MLSGEENGKPLVGPLTGIQAGNQGGGAGRSQGAEDTGRAQSLHPTLCTKELFSPKLGSRARWSGGLSVRVSKWETEVRRAPCCTQGTSSLIQRWAPSNDGVAM